LCPELSESLLIHRGLLGAKVGASRPS
jgi:hypothetical protein